MARKYRALLHALDRLGDYPPRYSFAAYAVAIAAFALFYTCISDHFYHPYVKFEQSMHREEANISQGLANAFRREIKSQPKSRAGWSVDPKRTSVVEVASDGNDLFMKLAVALKEQSPRLNLAVFSIRLKLSESYVSSEDPKTHIKEWELFPIPEESHGEAIPTAFVRVMSGTADLRQLIIDQFSRIQISDREMNKIIA